MNPNCTPDFARLVAGSSTCIDFQVAGQIGYGSSWKIRLVRLLSARRPKINPSRSVELCWLFALAHVGILCPKKEEHSSIEAKVHREVRLVGIYPLGIPRSYHISVSSHPFPLIIYHLSQKSTFYFLGYLFDSHENLQSSQSWPAVAASFPSPFR